MSTWLISKNGAAGVAPEALGLILVGGEYRSGSASSVTLATTEDFDAAETFAYGDAILITRDATPFFSGAVRRVPKAASGNAEGQSYIVEDAWAQMERTTYQEEWAVGGASTVLLPRVILGMDDVGTRITVAEQITAAVDFAIAAGISLTMGSVPTGMLLWPTEVTGLSIAEVIRTSLRFYPDWIPWIDHSTSPPTFHVTARAAATARTLAVTACTEFSVTKTSDRVPDCVRIVYLTATEDGGTVYRDGGIDKYPVLGDDSGPGVLTTVVDLAGTRAQVQKQQIHTRTLPTDADSQTAKKAYLKAKFPAIATLDDADFTVTGWFSAVIPETETLPDDINPEAPRLPGSTLAHLPRELVKGAAADWMRVRIGKVSLQFGVAGTATATDAEMDLLATLPGGEIEMTATNAVTKIYKGLASWTPAEDIPTGIAEAYYNTLASGCYYEGSVTLIENDVGATRWHGSKLHLSGGVAAWASMGAPIHAVRWDLATQQVTISFGPNPDYAIQDFLEFLRLLNKRPASWMSAAERASPELGDTAGPSAAGDTGGALDFPKTEILAPEPIPAMFQPHAFRHAGSTWSCRVREGYVVGIDPILGASPMDYHLATIGSSDPMATTDIEVSASHTLYLRVLTNALDLVTSAQIISSTSTPTSTHAQPATVGLTGAEVDAPVEGDYYYRLADFELAADKLRVKNQYLTGALVHRPGRTGQTAALTFYGCDGYPIERADWAQGVISSLAATGSVQVGETADCSSPIE